MILSLGAAMGFTSCDDLFEPAQENLKDVDQMYDDSKFAQGFLVNVYRNIPAYYDNSDYATDDAVTNETDNAFRKMTSGSWTMIRHRSGSTRSTPCRTLTCSLRMSIR